VIEQLQGIYCALWTPTDMDGHVLWPELEKHLSFVLDRPVAGIMALGSTGEFVHFSLSQRQELLEKIIARCKARGRQVIANVSDVQVRNAIALARSAKSLGADCIAVLPPWFFPLERRDLAEFFIAVARPSDLPLMLYNFPEVSGKKIELETIRLVAKNTKLVAVKQSGADFSYHHELVRLGRELGFAVLTGADTRLEEALQLGCSGTVCGLANSVPGVLAEIFNSFKRGQRSPEKTAFMTELARRMAPLLFPLNVKATIEALGFETGASKMPVSAETAGIYERVVHDLKAHFQSASLC
jgi:dihydrodipicolinate synthase/N-acetylneuraminate lyase